MGKYTLGIDSGSTYCKAALFSDHKILETYAARSSWQVEKTAREAAVYLLDRHGIDFGDCNIISTGYGRESISFAHKTLTEITAHSLGGFYLAPEIQGIIDIGGQDSKVIKMQKGKVVNFYMNDKCAAGTGRFLEMACSILEVDLSTLDTFLKTEEFVQINSMCTVFAESEIIGLMAKSTSRELILNGVLRSIAIRIQGMISKLQCKKGDVFLITGGLSRSNRFIEILSEINGLEINSHRDSPFAGALGAAISWDERN